MTRIHVAVAALLITASAAIAQETPSAPPRLEAGARVRVGTSQMHEGRTVAGTHRWHTGTVRTVDGRMISLRPEHGDAESEITFPFDAIQDLEISHGAIGGRRSRGLAARRGAATGALVVGVPLVLLGAFSQTESENDRVPWERFPIVFAAGGTAGGLLGFVFGGRSRERWVAIPKPEALMPPARPNADPR